MDIPKNMGFYRSGKLKNLGSFIGMKMLEKPENLTQVKENDYVDDMLYFATLFTLLSLISLAFVSSWDIL